LVSLDMVKHRLAQRVDSLVPQLFPNARRDGPHWRMGSLSGEPGQSLAINRSGNFMGLWQDFSSGERGSMLDLVAHGLCGGDIGQAIVRAREITGLGQLSPAEMRTAERRAEQARQDAAREEAERDEKVFAGTKRIFHHECQPVAGTAAERYLSGRGIHLSAMERIPSALRFHPGLMHPKTKALHPCLVALVMGLDGEPKGLHRTFLSLRADGSVGKLTGLDEDGEALNAKLSWGKIKGGHIPLWRGASDLPMGRMPAGEWIVLTEGIEDALSAAYEVPDRRVWAGVSLSNMGGIELPEACGGVYWHRHRDGPDATAAALRAIERLRNTGVAVREIWAPGTHKDFNEARQAAEARRYAGAGPDAEAHHAMAAS
jgi:hypothetical protein